MEKKLVVLAGAGASYSVDPKQYPTTLGFRERISDKIASSHLFIHAESFLEAKRKETPPFDIEKILWVLKEFEDAYKVSCDPHSFSNYLHSTGLIAAVSGMTNGQQVLAQMDNGLKANQSLIAEINALVYSLYGAVPDESALRDTWIGMLTWATRSFSKVDVFTTNYDIAIEEALQYIPNSGIDTAHRTRHGTTLDLQQWRFPDRETGLLTKLHGSVDWQYGAGGTDDLPLVRIVGPEFFGSHDRRAIIYPGYKEAPNRQPFQLFHTYFSERLREATHVIGVGFAFRDEYINGLVRQAGNDRQALIVDPTPRSAESYPPLGTFTFMKRGFGAKANGLLGLDFFDSLTAWAEGRNVA